MPEAGTMNAPQGGGHPDATKRGRRSRHSRRGATKPAHRPTIRTVNYRTLRNPFAPAKVFSDDRVEAIHQAALDVLETQGMKILLPEARARFRAAGARVDDDSQMVRIGRDIVEEAVSTAPRSIRTHAGSRHRDQVIEPGALHIQTGAGSPNVTDLSRGRRPGTYADFIELVKLNQSFDVFHMLTPMVEPQDLPPHLRHYDVTVLQLTVSDKLPFVFCRGTAQVEDCFEMIRLARGLDEPGFRRQPCCHSIINTNSPRQLDIPMAQGLIDFARWGQLMIVTPFCLMGAMAPVTIAGALTLSHAEALSAIALSQLTRAGAPVCYGAFVSNVDMKSGAPAFGTPEQVKANIGAGQLARRLGLPWRCSTGAAGAVNDAQAANETQMGAWGAVLAGATILIHGAGWIEGGLTFSYEKLITDLEVMQTFAELCTETPSDDASLALDALTEVDPGGHFFGAAHTIERYESAFYEPVVADWSNFGTWAERGGLDANQRANRIWKQVLEDFEPPNVDSTRLGEAIAFAERRKSEGGAPPPG